MPFKIFRQILRFLHFSDYETADSNDRLRKIRLIISLWNEKFSQIYTPHKNINIDESCMKFKRCITYKQFNSSKRTRFGLKIYKLCRINTRFWCNLKIYMDEDKSNRSDSAAQNVTMELTKSMINKRYILFFDK